MRQTQHPPSLVAVRTNLYMDVMKELIRIVVEKTVPEKLVEWDVLW